MNVYELTDELLAGVPDLCRKLREAKVDYQVRMLLVAAVITGQRETEKGQREEAMAQLRRLEIADGRPMTIDEGKKISDSEAEELRRLLALTRSY